MRILLPYCSYYEMHSKLIRRNALERKWYWNFLYAPELRRAMVLRTKNIDLEMEWIHLRNQFEINSITMLTIIPHPSLHQQWSCTFFYHFRFGSSECRLRRFNQILKSFFNPEDVITCLQASDFIEFVPKCYKISNAQIWF